MKDYMKELDELCEKTAMSITHANKKLSQDSNPISVGDADYLDKLTHMMKSIKTIMAMDEYNEDDYSERNSYARGRNVRRDSMGRYNSRRNDGYSYHDGRESMIDRLNDIMYDAPDERTRQEVQRLISKMQSM